MNSGELTDTLVTSPAVCSAIRVNREPSTSSTEPDSNVPIRTFGPERSCRIGILIPNSASAVLMFLMVSACSTCVSCENEIRAKSMPETTNDLINSTDLLAGPIVQTIFVRLLFI